MDFHGLTCFVMLAETLHFKRASERCHMSPSAFSRTIKRLEEELGMPLLIRDTREVKLTAEGRSFLARARQILSVWEEARSELGLAASGVVGTVRIFASVTACYSILAKILPLFRGRYPSVHIHVETGGPSESLPAVLEERVDVGVIARPDVLPEVVEFYPVTTTPLVFIRPEMDCAVSRLLDGGTIDWGRVPLILPEGEPARERIEAWFRKEGIRPTVYGEASGNEAILAMVSLGCGVGLVPALVLEKSPLKHGVRVVETAPQLPPYEVGFAVRKRRAHLPVVRAFLECVEDARGETG